MTRSIAQDMGLNFHNNFIGKIFPEKMVDSVDIGKVCTDWAYNILTNLEYDPLLQKKLMMIIRISYLDGENLDKDELWHDYLSLKGLPSFSAKVDGMPIIAKLSFMGQLEKPENKDVDEDDDIW